MAQVSAKSERIYALCRHRLADSDERHCLPIWFSAKGCVMFSPVAQHEGKLSSAPRGCGSVGRASPCQGEGRGFESRHPLWFARYGGRLWWRGREARQRPAKPYTRVRIPSPPRNRAGAIGAAVARFLHTEEVTGSIPVSRTEFAPQLNSLKQARLAQR